MNHFEHINFNNYKEAFYYYAEQEPSLLQSYLTIDKILRDNQSEDYDALFIYFMIEKKVPISQFNDVIQKIYHFQTVQELEKIFQLFFNNHYDTSSPLRYFNQLEKSVDTINIWDHISYCFLQLEDKKLTIREDRLIYLQSICEFIDKNSIRSLIGSRFVFFIHSLFDDFSKLKPLFSTFLKNPSFSQEINKNKALNKDFFNRLLFHICHTIYEKPLDEIHYAYSILNNNIDNFESVYLKSLTQFIPYSNNTGAFTLQIQDNLFCLAHLIGEEQTINFISKQYRELMTYNLNHSSFNNQFDIKNLTTSLIASIHSSFSTWGTYLKGTIFNIDLNDIDVNQDIIHNFVPVQALSQMITLNLKPLVTQEIINYIRKEIDTNKENANTNFITHYELEKLLNITQLLNYFDYVEMDSKISHKEEPLKLKKNKI